MKLRETPAPMGRPRAFDVEQALDRAMRVFWQKGYEGTSLTDLTEAMGINRPSLYAAFGNKAALFYKALDRYAEGPANYVREALEQPRARDVVERIWLGAVDLLSDPETPAGCLLVQGALTCGDAAASVKRELVYRRLAGEADVRERLERARAEGDLPDGADPADLARYVSAVAHGLAVLAASGAGRDELRRVVETAMRAIPV